ncbi:hypothetical protein WMF04_23780 [Sorangium sp. So ce260]|uniref:hypothetical protein n=1 Tax=Sorangium sp. So ce260 TaxID=3133291 RepID=UPI003F5EC11D
MGTRTQRAAIAVGACLLGLGALAVHGTARRRATCQQLTERWDHTSKTLAMFETGMERLKAKAARCSRDESTATAKLREPGLSMSDAAEVVRQRDDAKACLAEAIDGLDRLEPQMASFRQNAHGEKLLRDYACK